MLILFIAGIIFLCVKIGGMEINESRLAGKSCNLKVYDCNNNEIDASGVFPIYTELSQIPDDLINAFVCLEDKKFYSHHGIDYRRIAGAFVTNIKSGSFKEGASTITQQLIKNTHLSSEKTFMRKLQEAKLALELEKRYSKDEIMEKYLNVIYYGSGNYGISQAANNYFDKKPKELTLSECALLAGTVKNPSKYSPVANIDNAIARRNLVLKIMLQDGVINENQYNSAISENIIINNRLNKNSLELPYLNMAIKEASEKLNIPKSELLYGGYEIYTGYDPIVQKSLFDSLTNLNHFSVNENGNSPDASSICIDNKSRMVSAFYATYKNSGADVYRQPGSTIKPLAVYAPAYENGKLSNGSILIDEEFDFNGYRPSNYNDAYYGAVSPRIAVEKSLNIPAVKVLSEIGIKDSIEFLNKIGIETLEEDKNLALALGGMTKGTTIKQLAGAYCMLANNGIYCEPNFVKEVKGAKGYRTVLRPLKVMENDNAYLLTDILLSTAKTGTAKKLNVDYQIAAKTGTVGTNGGNSDAWLASYTDEITLCVWQGNLSNAKDHVMKSSVTGGSYPSIIARSIYDSIYEMRKPCDFQIPDTIMEVELDKFKWQQGEICMANPFIDLNETITEKFKLTELPQKVSDRNLYESQKESRLLSMKSNHEIYLQFYTQNGYIYKLYKDSAINRQNCIFQTNGNDRITTFTLPRENHCAYYLKRYKNIFGFLIDDGWVSNIVTDDVFMMPKETTAFNKA